ncbi:hypothetical protein MRX96_048198 [Rhipicephalus microplus]
MEATRLLDAGCLGRLGRPLPGPYAPFGTPMAPYSMAAYPPHHVPYSIDGILHGSHAAAAASHHGGPLGLVMASSPGHAALVGSRAAVLSHRIAAAQHHHQEQQHHQAASRVSSHRSKGWLTSFDITKRFHVNTAVELYTTPQRNATVASSMDLDSSMRHQSLGVANTLQPEYTHLSHFPSPRQAAFAANGDVTADAFIRTPD